MTAYQQGYRYALTVGPGDEWDVRTSARIARECRTLAVPRSTRAWWLGNARGYRARKKAA